MGGHITLTLPNVAGLLRVTVAGVCRELPGFGHFATTSANVQAVDAATG